MANRRNRTEVISQPVPAHVLTAIRTEIAVTEAKREAMRAELERAENHRADRRNRNRVALLILTIVNTFVAANIMNGIGLHWLIVRYPTSPVAWGFVFDLVFVIFAWKRKM